LKAYLRQPRVAKRDVHLSKRNQTFGSASLVLRNPVAVIYDPGTCCDDRQEPSELCAELLDLRIVDGEEEEQLCLLGQATTQDVALHIGEQVIANRLLGHGEWTSDLVLSLIQCKQGERIE
jgi:hypothetical protein